jgi:hypothetical protein
MGVLVGIVAQIVGGLIAVFGVLYGLSAVQFINEYVKSENIAGDGWADATSLQTVGCIPWDWYWGFQVKLGAVQWIYVITHWTMGTFTGLWVIPTGVGGQYLGLGNI